MTFGEKCKKYRSEAKLTQQQTADAINVSRRTYIYYETGRKLPRSRRTVEKLAGLFGIDPNLLIIENDERFIELQRERPAAERIISALDDVRAILSDGSIDPKQKQDFASKLAGLCADLSVSNGPASANDNGGFNDNIL